MLQHHPVNTAGYGVAQRAAEQFLLVAVGEWLCRGKMTASHIVLHAPNVKSPKLLLESVAKASGSWSRMAVAATRRLDRRDELSWVIASVGTYAHNKQPMRTEQ
jgi:hypothetical protein